MTPENVVSPTPVSPTPMTAQIKPTVPFKQTKIGAFILKNIVNLVVLALVLISFGLLFAPVFGGQNIWYFVGKSLPFWEFILAFILLIIVLMLTLFNVLVNKIPRMIALVTILLFGFTLGCMSMFVGVYSSLVVRFGADYEYIACKSSDKPVGYSSKSDCEKEVADDLADDSKLMSAPKSKRANIEMPIIISGILLTISALIFLLEKHIKALLKLS